MGRRMYGNVEKLGSGRFRVRYLGPDGVRRTAPMTFATRGDADRWISTTRAEIFAGKWIDRDISFWQATGATIPKGVSVWRALIGVDLEQAAGGYKFSIGLDG